MRLGDIHNFINNRIRILMFDKNEVFYGLVNQDGTFEFSKNKTINYYRIPRDFFENNADFMGSLELSNEELMVHRPNLPLRLNCFDDVFWSNELFETINDFENFIIKTKIDFEKLEGLNNSKIFIVPTSQLMSNKKPILIHNESGSINGKDLLLQCFRIQSEYIKMNKLYFSRFRLIENGREEKRLSGIGLYRLGIKDNIPSYYIGGAISMVELESNQSLIVQ